MPEMENGGVTLTDEYAKKIGADYRALDAIDGIAKCREWIVGERVK